MMKKHSQLNPAFTLIQLLVVIAIIMILVGIVLRVGTFVHRRTAEAKTTETLKLVEQCVEEYYRAYGRYPPESEDPVQHGTEYESPGDGDGYPPDWDIILPAIKAKVPGFNESGYTGLVYYITAEDCSFRKPESERWEEYYGAIGTHRHLRQHTYTNLPIEGWSRIELTNEFFMIADAWDGQLVYRCPVPHQSYTVYSKGPDGAADTPDDVGRAGE